MHKELIINSTPNEVRVALMEDHEVVEFSMERADNRRAVGNVYKGVVTAVRPGLQAAFVDIGMEKAGFLHVSDLIHDSPEEDDDRGRGARGGRRRRRSREGLRPIETMLKEGDEILVQVTKEVIGTKGPRLTADVSLPGRYMVLMPKGDHVGVSRKIEDRKERHRLRDLLSDLKPDDEGGAFIIRTAAIGVEGKMLERDMEYLRRMWKEVQERSHTLKAPCAVHEDVGLIVSLIRDILKDDINRVLVDSKEDYQQLVGYVKNFSPELRDRIEMYHGEIPIFDKFGIEAELKKSLDRKVWMKRGGFLVIEQTEALVAIDVNTGRYTGKKNQAETIFKTNMLAAKEIARQLRLRDVGGIIVLDFIDMDSEDDKRRVLNELRTYIKHDRARTKTFAISDLGLIEMSRQRVQESLKDRLSDHCPYCNGTGQVLSIATLANKVERLLLKLSATAKEKAVQVRANPTLALALMSDRANSLQQLARSTGIQIDVVDDPRLHREEFQIVSAARRKDLVAEIEKASAGAAPRHSDADEPRRRSDSESRGRSEEDRPRRRRSREDGAEGEDSRRRPRRRRSEEGGEESRTRRDSGSSRDEDRRRRRGSEEGNDERRSRGGGSRRRSEPEAVVAETRPSAAPPTDQEDGEDGAPRRRRRRGRRGGRGRRKPGDAAQTETAGSPREQDASPENDSRPSGRNEDAPVAESKPEAASREENNEEPRRRRPRSRRGGRRASEESQSAASMGGVEVAEDVEAPREVKESRKEVVEASAAEQASGREDSLGQTRSERRSRRRDGRRSRSEESSPRDTAVEARTEERRPSSSAPDPVAANPVADRGSYVQPVSESSHVAAEKPAAEPASPPEADTASKPVDRSEGEERTPRRRRRVRKGGRR